MDTPLILPEGFSARPCVLADVESDDIRSEWTRPSFDLDGSTIVVVEDATGTLVAQGEVTYGQRADCSIHPNWRGRGIGSWLVQWTEDRARAQGASRIGQTVVDTATDAAGTSRRLHHPRLRPGHGRWDRASPHRHVVPGVVGPST